MPQKRQIMPYKMYVCVRTKRPFVIILSQSNRKCGTLLTSNDLLATLNWNYNYRSHKVQSLGVCMCVYVLEVGVGSSKVKLSKFNLTYSD